MHYRIEYAYTRITGIKCVNITLDSKLYILYKKADYVYEDVILMSCIEGYQYENGHFNATCAADTSWNVTMIPTCKS